MDQARKRRVCIATGTRAEWGLLSPIAHALSHRDDVDVVILVTNMHLSSRYGHTVDEIEAEGLSIGARVAMIDDDAADDGPAATVAAMGRCLVGMAPALESLHPDLMVILGDRYEMLVVAEACAIFRIPVVHLHGGEITEGAYDDSIRHAVTKLSSLHLTSTEQYRRRVIQLGEDPRRVINTGSIGVYSLTRMQPMSRAELETSIGLDITPGTMLVTFHPCTLDRTPVARQCGELLDALDHFPDSHIIFTYPNSDTDGRVIIDMIGQYVARNPRRAVVHPSLGYRRYISALHYVSAVVGNSSSGIIEVPSMGIPTVDIGRRQQGRLSARSVTHCPCRSGAIELAIAYALSPAGQAAARTVDNPYSKPDTLDLIVDAIVRVPLKSLETKHFHDLPVNDSSL